VHHRGGRWRYCSGAVQLPFPLLVEHPQISGPGGAEISFCHTIDHCRTTLYYTVLYLDLAPRRRYCRLFTLLYRPGRLPGAQTLTMLLGCTISFLMIGRLVIAQSCMNSAASPTLTDYIRRRLQFTHSDQQLDRSYQASPAVPRSSGGDQPWRLNLREYFIQWPANLRHTVRWRCL